MKSFVVSIIGSKPQMTELNPKKQKCLKFNVIIANYKMIS